MIRSPLLAVKNGTRRYHLARGFLTAYQAKAIIPARIRG